MTKFAHSGIQKKSYVQKMFNDIAIRYDFLNHFLSLGIDYYWRKKFINLLKIDTQKIVVDVATGTGDIARLLSKQYNVKVVGLDYAFNMLKVADQNLRSDKNISLLFGDAENLPFRDNSVDMITVSFGFRNFGNYNKALSEFHRILKPHGKIGILEFGTPKNRLIQSCFNIYFQYLLPFIGKVFSSSDGYKYLPESVNMFLTNKQIKKMVTECQLHLSHHYKMTFGICNVFLIEKR